MMASTLRNLFLLAAIAVPALTFPTVEPAIPFMPNLYEQPSLQHTNTDGSPFRRIRNSIIERIWGRDADYRSKHVRPGQSVLANYRKKYGNDMVLRFTMSSNEEMEAFMSAANTLFLDVWDSSDNWTDVRIAKDVLPSFLKQLPESMQNSHRPLMHDLAMAVHDTYPSSGMQSPHWKSRQTQSPGVTDLLFDDYQPLSVIYPWMRFLASLYPHLTSLTTIGTSAEGREILALRIGSRAKAKPDEPHQTVLVTAGSHAREWISISTTLYMAYDMLLRYVSSSEPILTKFLDHYDIIFVPVLNPDGYEYTWTTDRLWRKSRQPTEIPFCPGIDLDRSFPFFWDGHADTDNPCTESYAGKEPLEAVESRLLSEWAKNITNQGNVFFAGYIGLHSYSQKVLYPYSYTCHNAPANLEDLEEVAQGIAKNFRITTGHFYGVESACEGSVTMNEDHEGVWRSTPRIASSGTSGGSSLDYFYAEHNIKYAYQIKLRDTGTYGFLLPKDNIVPSGREAVEAMIGFGRWLLGDRGIESKRIFHEENGEEIPDSTAPSSHDLSTEELEILKYKETEDFDDDDSEWERVYDPDFELRRRR